RLRRKKGCIDCYVVDASAIQVELCKTVTIKAGSFGLSRKYLAPDSCSLFLSMSSEFDYEPDATQKCRIECAFHIGGHYREAAEADNSLQCWRSDRDYP